MSRVVPRVAFCLIAAALTFPFFAYAFPFGGQISLIRPCYNTAIFARVGPPRGGDFIWAPSTRTYSFGAPRRAGQWLLGLTGIPVHCVVSIQPIDVWPGIYIMMMGSSQ